MMSVRQLVLLIPTVLFLLGMDCITGKRDDTDVSSDTDVSDQHGCLACQEYTVDVDECYHVTGDVNGAPCSDRFCIDTRITTATCGVDPDLSSVDEECNMVSTGNDAATLTSRDMGDGNCSSASTVQWVPLVTLGYIDGDECVSNPLRKACEIAVGTCKGPIDVVERRMGQFECL